MRVVDVTVSATFADKHLPADPQGAVAFTVSVPGAALSPSGGNLTFRRGEPHVALDVTATGWLVPDAPTSWVIEIAASAGTPTEIRTSPANLLKPDALEDLWLTVTYEKVTP